MVVDERELLDPAPDELALAHRERDGDASEREPFLRRPVEVDGARFRGLALRTGQPLVDRAMRARQHVVEEAIRSRREARFDP